MSKKQRTIKKKFKHRCRHGFFYRLLRPLVKVFLKIKFGYKSKRANKLPCNYIVLSNHTTDFDPLFVASSFQKPMYFVASEHVTKWKRAYWWLNMAFNPIIRYKGTIASNTVKDILRRIKCGCNVCIFAEGMRSWDGITAPILPSTAKLIKSAKCGLVTYKITGGYFASPNWSEKGTRRGNVYGSPVNTYTADELSKMSDDEIMNIINTDLYEDAYATQKSNPCKYKGKRLAERIENFIFKCPYCGANDSIVSSGKNFGCSKCGTTYTYDEYGMIGNCEFQTITELSNWQKTMIVIDAQNNATYTTPNAILYKVNTDHERELIAEGPLSMNTQSITCNNESFDINNIRDMTIFGKHGIVFEHDTGYYEIDVDKIYNAYKYILYFNVIKNK